MSKQNSVFVLDRNKTVLAPTHPASARKLLDRGKAAVYRLYPFTIILNRVVSDASPQPIRLKVDPGSRTTGLALVQENQSGDTVVWAAELEHRGQKIKKSLLSRRQLRRGRRGRKTRYRKPRFSNRTRPEGWLAPSLRSRVDNTQAWFTKLYKVANVESISTELVRFDTQKMNNAEISGVEYQQGELAGYEVREYLLEKWGRKCSYCKVENVPLQVEHITPKIRGGSNRVSNLCLACEPCNQKKNSQTAAEFGHPEIQAKAKKPLNDAAAVNSTRWAIFGMFKDTGLPVETGTGGRTKYNRSTQDYKKGHWIDAACVGESGKTVNLDPDMQVLSIGAVGRGSRQMCRVDKYGFPRAKAKSVKRVFGFQTGDFAKAVVPKGKYAGVHYGRLAIRANGSFTVITATSKFSTNWKNCEMRHRSDGYSYQFKKGEEDEICSNK